MTLWRCPVCSKRVRQFRNHVRRAHPHYRWTEAELAPMALTPCPRCTFPCDGNRGLAAHFGSAHRGESAPPSTVITAASSSTVRAESQPELEPLVIDEQVGDSVYSRPESTYNHRLFFPAFNTDYVLENAPVRPPWRSVSRTQQPPVPHVGPQDEEEWEIDAIYSFEMRYDENDQPRPYYYVSWKGFPASENSWCPADDLGNGHQIVALFCAYNFPSHHREAISIDV